MRRRETEYSDIYEGGGEERARAGVKRNAAKYMKEGQKKEHAQA